MLLICPYYCDKDCMKEMFDSGVAISAFSVTLALGISIYLIVQHLRHFNFPQFQSKIIIILLMAPFYGLVSIVSLQLPDYATYLELFRDIYLAFLLFTFFYLMFAYIAYDPDTKTVIDDRVYEAMIMSETAITHLFPFNYCTHQYLLTTKAKAKYFTYRCKKFVLQYFVIKPLLVILLIVAHPFVHDNKTMRLLSIIFEVIIILSEAFSLYYLILFYYALKKPLSPHKPLLKFLIIKITLFFTFWQSLMLAIMKDDIAQCFDVDNTRFTPDSIISSMEVIILINLIINKKNTLVCVEMLLMTIACICAFGYVQFKTLSNQKGSISEVFQDVWRAFKHDFRLIKPKKFGFQSKVSEQELNLITHIETNDYEIKMYDVPRLSQAVKIQYF